MRMRERARILGKTVEQVKAADAAHRRRVLKQAQQEATARETGCPHCNASVGEPCRTVPGSYRTRYHVRRFTQALLLVGPKQ